jgi:TRAP-type uncharacterized transport system fused permease subunit
MLFSLAVYIFFGEGKYKERFINLKDVFLSAAQATGWLVILITLIQTAVSLINFSGLGVNFSTLVISWGKESLLTALLAAGFISLVLGMGMTTTAAYVIAISVVGYSLIKLGITPIAAHMFILYFAILSSITPPICTGAYTAAIISGAHWLPTGIMASRLGFVLFLVPVAFIYNPALLMIGEPIIIVLKTLKILLAFICISSALMGFFIKKIIIFERFLLLIGGLTLIFPIAWVNYIGLSLFLLSIISQISLRRE